MRNMKYVNVTIYGREYRALLLASHACGTIDVQLPSGRCFRVSGMNISPTV